MQKNEQAQKTLVQHTMRAVVRRETDARAVANVAYSAARIFKSENRLDDKLFVALAREAELRVSEFNAQNIANHPVVVPYIFKPQA